LSYLKRVLTGVLAGAVLLLSFSAAAEKERPSGYRTTVTIIEETAAPSPVPTPGAAVRPTVPADPETAGYPVHTKTPGSTANPVSTPEQAVPEGTPSGATVTPEITDAPEAAESPEIPETPEAAEPPEIPETPEATQTPAPLPLMTPIPTPKALPTVIDLVNDSETWGDFQFPKGSKLLEIWIPDIRDADAALILYDGQAWMIDCADQKMGLRTAAMLKWLGVTHIQKIFNTHPHHDHILGLDNVLDVARVDELLVCFPLDVNEHMRKTTALCRLEHITISAYQHGDTFSMGDGEVRLLFWQNRDESLSMNNRSACTMITYGNRSFLTLADLEYQGQKALEELVGDAALKCDLFKYPHHGKQAMKESFFRAMDADATIITNFPGIEKAYTYLAYKHFPMIPTNKSGLYTHLICDGKRWICEYVPFN